MSAPTRFLAALLLSAYVMAEDVPDIDPTRGWSLFTPHLRDHIPYGIKFSAFKEAFKSPAMSSQVKNVSITEDRGWDVGIQVAANISTGPDKGFSEDQVSQVLAFSIKPADGGPQGNTSLCLSVFSAMEESREEHLLREGSATCEDYYMGACNQALEYYHQSGTGDCGSGLPDSCKGYLKLKVSSFGFYTSQLDETGITNALFLDPQDKGSKDAYNDLRGLSQRGYVVVMADPFAREEPFPSTTSRANTVLCMAPVRLRPNETYGNGSDSGGARDKNKGNGKGDDKDDDGDEDGGDSGTLSLTSSAMTTTLLVAALMSMLFASI